MKKHYKKIISVVLCLTFALALSACGGKTNAPASSGDSQSAAKGELQKSENGESSVLVCYFSATGTTRTVGEKIAAATGADIYEIKPKVEYTSADLDWNDSESRSTKEQNDPSARPELAGEELSLDKYTTIYIGYPIWWGKEPRIMDTFIEKYDFSGKTVIPFCTSGSSDIGSSGENLKENAKSGSWLSGERFGANATDAEIKAFVSKIE